MASSSLVFLRYLCRRTSSSASSLISQRASLSRYAASYSTTQDEDGRSGSGSEKDMRIVEEKPVDSRSDKFEEEEKKNMMNNTGGEDKDEVVRIYHKSYEEAEDHIFEMAETLLPKIKKPVYNIWDFLQEEDRNALGWSESGGKTKGNEKEGQEGTKELEKIEVGEEEKEKKEEEERQLEIGDLVADMYEDEQWDIVEDDVVDAEQTMGSAAADHHESALGPVSDFKDTIFQWEYFLVLHPHATVLPRHPKNDKVRLTVHLENLCAYYGLSEAQKSHIALICGPRYTPKTDTVLLTTQTHESRIDNQKYLMKVVKDLVDEAKRFIPQES